MASTLASGTSALNGRSGLPGRVPPTATWARPPLRNLKHVMDKPCMSPPGSWLRSGSIGLPQNVGANWRQKIFRRCRKIWGRWKSVPALVMGRD